MASEAARAVVGGAEPPKLRDRKARHPNKEGFFHFIKTTVSGMYPQFEAPKLCIDCVEAAIDKGFDDGMLVERQHFLGLAASPQFRALKHVFLADKAAGKLVLKDATGARPTPRDIQRVGVVEIGRAHV